MIDVVPLSFRDCCFVAANIRQEDWDECRCQMDEENKFLLANLCFFNTANDLKWCGRINGQPVVAMGFSKSIPTVYHVWMWGTTRIKKIFPVILRFMVTEGALAVKSVGCTRVEMRSMFGHDLMCWPRRCGAQDCGSLYKYGKNGETFRLFAWSEGVYEPKLRRMGDVFEYAYPKAA